MEMRDCPAQSGTSGHPMKAESSYPIEPVVCESVKVNQQRERLCFSHIVDGFLLEHVGRLSVEIFNLFIFYIY